MNRISMSAVLEARLYKRLSGNSRKSTCMADINIRSGRLIHMQSKPDRKRYLNKQEEGTYRPLFWC